MQKLNAIETFEALQKTNRSCGQEILSRQQRLRWGPLAADSESINEARHRYQNSSDPAELKLIVHAMSKHNHPDLCDWVSKLARLRSNQRANITQCKEKKPLRGFPISRYNTLAQIIVDTPALDK